ncbi:MAG: FAD-binding protein [Vicinamibacterales bacterium]
MWVAFVFIGFLAYDVWLACWFTDPATGAVRFGVGLGTIVLAVNVVLLACYTWGVVLRLLVRRPRRLSKSPVCDYAYTCVSGLNSRHQLFAWCSLFSVAFAGIIASAITRCSQTWISMPVAAANAYDVLIIGAGGAGLRAAIEAARACRWASSADPARQGPHRDGRGRHGGRPVQRGRSRDNWRVHFADTMRGGRYVNNWRMAELHAKEAPAREVRRRARGVGRGVRPHARRPHPPAQFRRPPLSPARARGRSHRTGTIRTLQDHTIHQGVTVHMEHTVVEVLLDDGRVAGVLAYDRERGRFHLFSARAVVLATGGVGRAYQITSNSWEGTGDGHALAYRAGAELIDMEFIQFHPTGMVWPPSVKGILVTEGVRGEGGILKNSEGRRFMFDDIPDNYKPQTASDPDEGWRYTQGDKSARRPPELLTRDHVARCINREVKAGRGSPHRACSSTSPGSGTSCRTPRHTSSASCSMYPQFKELADLDITKTPMEVGPTTRTTSWEASGWTRRRRRPRCQELFAAGECGRDQRINRLGGNSCPA